MPGAATVTQPQADTLTDPTRIGEDFTWRQKLHARYGEDEFDFEAVIEKSGNTLRVLFLTPYGTRALLLEQLGQKVSTRYFVSQRLPFPARYILGDIHRVFFRGFAPEKPTDGAHTHEQGGERFEDTWRRGVIIARTVTPDKGARKGAEPASAAVTIRYTPGYRPGLAPGRVHLDNQRHGYEIAIDTLLD
jgi:hypothetical protein